MKNTIITIDLASAVFELTIANPQYRITQRRLDRDTFRQFIHDQAPALLVMEACGSAHHWGRLFREWGHKVLLLPAQYVRPYRRRNKTDRTDCEALLEAYRCEGIKPVAVESVEQQELQLLGVSITTVIAHLKKLNTHQLKLVDFLLRTESPGYTSAKQRVGRLTPAPS